MVTAITPSVNLADQGCRRAGDASELEPDVVPRPDEAGVAGEEPSVVIAGPRMKREPPRTRC